jgi:hypothetical protein
MAASCSAVADLAATDDAEVVMMRIRLEADRNTRELFRDASGK